MDFYKKGSLLNESVLFIKCSHAITLQTTKTNLPVDLFQNIPKFFMYLKTKGYSLFIEFLIKYGAFGVTQKAGITKSILTMILESNEHLNKDQTRSWDVPLKAWCPTCMSKTV